MSHVGTRLSAGFDGWATRCRQFVGGSILFGRVKSLAVPILVGFFPIGLTLRIVRGNWTSVPYYDEWWTPGRQIVSFLHGTLRFADLFQQHNESRKLFPKLYYLGLVAVTGRWDVKDAMVLMLALACLGSILLLLLLLSQTTTLTLPGRLWAWAVLNYVFFCPREYENFLWGIQLEPLTPGVALLAAVIINLSPLKFRWKILANSALAFLATYSYANGMLLWVLAAPMYVRGRLAERQNRSAKPAGWYAFYLVCGIVFVGFYFHHYVHPTQHPPFAVSPRDILPLARFLLSWVGSLFDVSGADPLFFGCFFVGIFSALVIAAIAVARREGNFRRFYPWVVIAAYALLSGAIIASGRLRFGIGSATAPKYAVVVVFFYIGLTGLAASLYEVWAIAGHPMRSRLIFGTGLTMGLFAAGWLSSLGNQLARVKIVREERKDLALAIQWVPAIQDNPDFALAKVPANVVAEEAIALSMYDALRPRLISPSLASIVRENPADGDLSVGTLTSARFSDDHRLLLTGMAWLPRRNARADCVVVGYANADGRLTPFTVFQPTYKREKLKGRFDVNRLPPNGFAAAIDPSNLPMGALRLQAWAVDMRAARALPMAGAITVDKEPVQTH